MLSKIIGLSVLVILIAALGWGFRTNFKFLPTKSSQPKIITAEKLRIGNIGEYSIFNIIAKEKNYFQQNRLEAEIKEYSAGPASIEALLKGEVDVAVAADFVGVNYIFKDPKLRILSSASKQQVFQVLGRKDKGINNPADLKNKKIGVTRKSSGEFFLGRFLTFNNLSLNDLEIIDLPPTKIIAGLESGDLDAAVIFEPHAYNLKKKMGDNLNIWSAQSDQKTSALVYSTEEFIKTHPQIIEKYLKSLIQSEKFVRENEPQTKELISRSLNYDKDYLDYVWPKFIFAIGLNQEMLLDMEEQARWIIANGLTDQKTTPNYIDFIYFKGLEELKPESVTIIH